MYMIHTLHEAKTALFKNLPTMLDEMSSALTSFKEHLDRLQYSVVIRGNFFTHFKGMFGSLLVQE